MIEVSPGLYIPAAKIVNMRIFIKDNVRKVRIAIDTINPEERVCYSGEMQSEEQAKQFIQNCGNAM